MENLYDRYTSKKPLTNAKSIYSKNKENGQHFGKLPLLHNSLKGKYKSASNYSKSSPRKVAIGYYKRHLTKNSSQNSSTLRQALLTERELSPKSLFFEKQSGTVKIKQGNKPRRFQIQENPLINLQTPNNPKSKTRKRQSNMDYKFVPTSLETIETIKKYKTPQQHNQLQGKLFQYPDLIYSVSDVVTDLGVNLSLRTTDLLDNYRQHCREYPAEIKKPHDKRYQRQFEITKQLEKVMSLNKLSHKSIEVYIQCRKVRIQQLMNTKYLKTSGDNTKTHTTGTRIA